MKFRPYGLAVFCFLVVLAVASFAIRHVQESGSSEFASRAPANSRGPARAWALSGYLPNQPDRKVYVSIQGNRITQVGPQRPGGFVIETESLIFPGLMDMHNHIKYNVLPLWTLGKSQFLNRFEWRQKFPPYKDAVSFNMKAYKGSECVAVRWAEVKALAGGAVAMQGIGADGKCASGFGVLNYELPGDLSSARIRALTDLISPEYLASVFVPKIEPELKRRGNEFASGSDQQREEKRRQIYDDALLETLVRSGVLTWLEDFATKPRTLANGIKLLIEMDVNPRDNSPASFNALIPEITEFLKTKHGMSKEKQITTQITNMRLWLYGKDGKGYLAMPMKPPGSLKGLQFVEDSQTLDYFSKAGVISRDPKLRRYLGMFESATRRSVIKYYLSAERQAVIAHLSEGRRGDSYNKMEYPYALQMGLVLPGLVMIHGVGLDKDALTDAARKGLSIVWSPFSNLLLYGETLDVVAAKKAGVNLALGPDWSPTGSKNMLDELKIARRYLDKMKISNRVISDQDLVDMATVNPGKALGLEKTVGRVAAGYAANLLLIDRSTLNAHKNPYTALVRAEQEHVSLVVVNGEPLYGDVPSLQAAHAEFKDQGELEILPRGEGCGFKKAIRLPGHSNYDRDTQGAYRTVAALETELTKKLSDYAAQVRSREPSKAKHLVKRLDPIFKCEDPEYAQEFARYIEQSLDQNVRGRERLRQQYKLSNQWSPLKDAAPADDEEDENDAPVKN